MTEYVDRGRTLEQYYRDTHPIPGAKIAALVADVAAALDHAHGIGVYHPDIKPQNVLVGRDGRAKVIDFGLALFRPAWSGGADPYGASGGRWRACPRSRPPARSRRRGRTCSASAGCCTS